MCGFLKPKTPKIQETPKTPSKDEAAETARAESLERRRQVAGAGKKSTILAGGDEAKAKLKKVLGA